MKGNTPSRPWTLLLSCEHATSHIPSRWKGLFRNDPAVLKTHRGWDPGTLQLGRKLQKAFSAPLVVAKVSRLLIEMNRSLHHRKLFSDFSLGLPPDEKQELVERYWMPYRRQVVDATETLLRQGHRVLHLSLHSFTPVLGETVRNADVGLLYDPQRAGERWLCETWQRNFLAAGAASRRAGWRLRKNYPYRGIADGLTRGMRLLYDGQRYAGIELEISQAFPLGPAKSWNRLQDCLGCSLASSLGEFNSWP